MQSEINDKNRAAKMAAADSEVLAIRAEQSEEENRRQRATIEELTVEAEERTRILHEVEGRAEELEERYGALQRKYMEQRNMNSQLILDVQALKGNIQVRPYLTSRVKSP
jgi:predicted RNase H-like nuclease (RuvC/YqgF family)